MPAPNAVVTKNTRTDSFAHVPQHKRNPSAPTVYPQSQTYPYPQPPPATVRVRATTERVGLPLPHSPSGGILRKPAPRAQVPVSVNLDAPMDTEPSPDQEQFRAVLPSVVSSDAENMTGVGAVARGGGQSAHTPDVIYTTAEQNYVSLPAPSGPMTTSKRSRSPSPPTARSPPRPVSTRAKTPPLLTTLSRPSSAAVPRNSSSPVPQPDQPTSGKTSTLPLLSAGVFTSDLIRDSAFSSATGETDTSREIPIKWTGGFDPEAASSTGKVDRSAGSKLKHVSVEPRLPGAWSATPDEEKTEEATIGKTVDIVTEIAEGEPGKALNPQETTSERLLHDVDARIASPELVLNASEGIRKSEAGDIGMMTTPPARGNEPQCPVKREGGGAGWVLVNVEGKPRPEGEVQSSDRSPVHSRDTSKTLKAADLSTPKSQAPATLSPIAKSIIVTDAKGTNLAVDKAKNAVPDARPSGIKRLLSFSKRGETYQEPAAEFMTQSGGTAGTQWKASRLRDRLKRKGLPEVTPRSVDDKLLTN